MRCLLKRVVTLVDRQGRLLRRNKGYPLIVREKAKYSFYR